MTTSGASWSGFGGGGVRGSVGSSTVGGSLPGAPGTGFSSNEAALSATASAASPATFLAALTGFFGSMGAPVDG